MRPPRREKVCSRRLKYIFLGLLLIAARPQNLTVEGGGRPVGARSTLNLIPGNGIMHACVDNYSRQRVDCTPSFNTAVLATHERLNANENYSGSSNAPPR